MSLYSKYVINAKFSDIDSRRDIVLDKLPVISSNMTTVTGLSMAIAMNESNAYSCMHRFYSTTREQILDYIAVPTKASTFASFGLGDVGRDQIQQLADAGCRNFCLDVAHGAQKQVAQQVNWFRSQLGAEPILMVGNFGNPDSLLEFYQHLDTPKSIDYIKVGIGAGSVCRTTTKTGVGQDPVSAIQSISSLGRRYGFKTVADGGIKTPGDVCIALAAGASLVMLGSLLAGTTEAPGQSSIELDGTVYKTYKGSASQESYIEQGKLADWRTDEGVSSKVIWKGNVKDVLKDIEGSLRSSMSYVGARNIGEYHEKATLSLLP
jgi:IMP dehydrogenase/GMP reductase